MDLRLTGLDMDITNGDISFVNAKEAIGQDIKMAWRTFLDETPYDTSAGVPYVQIIFAQRNPNLNAVRFILQQIAERRPGVISVSLDPTLDTVTRELTVTGTADTIEGEIDFSELFAGESIV